MDTVTPNPTPPNSALEDTVTPGADNPSEHYLIGGSFDATFARLRQFAIDAPFASMILAGLVGIGAATVLNARRAQLPDLTRHLFTKKSFF